jgi:general secretion pathway protein A
MYLEYFGLKNTPFSIAPDPSFLYMSERHREALAHLLYGVSGEGGFIVLTGEVGTGKTTICRCFMQQIPENTDVAFVVNPKLSARELLATICDELKINYPAGSSIKVFNDLINKYLLDAHSQGRHTVLIIDEAQNLRIDVLEQLRLLTNLETSEKKLLQIILLGQPELKQMLARVDLRQLAQRITARYHLQSLTREETTAYIQCRLSVAGQKRALFTQQAIRKIFVLSSGIPRLINLICDRALLGAYSCNENQVEKVHVINAIKEMELTRPWKEHFRFPKWFFFRDVSRCIDWYRANNLDLGRAPSFSSVRRGCQIKSFILCCRN